MLTYALPKTNKSSRPHVMHHLHNAQSAHCIVHQHSTFCTPDTLHSVHANSAHRTLHTTHCAHCTDLGKIDVPYIGSDSKWPNNSLSWQLNLAVTRQATVWASDWSSALL